MAIRSNDAIDASTMNKRNRNSSNPMQASEGVLPTSSKQQSAGFDKIDHRRSRLQRFLMGMIGVGSLGLMLAGTTGCTMTSGICQAVGDHHFIDDFMIGHRDRVMAEKAWHCQKDRFCNKQHSREFKQGFIDGFNGVAQGGGGCMPTVAPKQFWGWRYQSAQGQSAVNAWFEGYPMGVAAAESAGIAEWGNIRTVGGLGPAPGMNSPASDTPPINPFYSESSSDVSETSPFASSQALPAEPTEADSEEDDSEEMDSDNSLDLDPPEDTSDSEDADEDSDEFDFGNEEDSVFNGAPIFQDQASGSFDRTGPAETTGKPLESMQQDSFEDSLDSLFAETAEETTPDVHVAELGSAIESQMSDQVSVSDEDDSDALPFSFE